MMYQEVRGYSTISRKWVLCFAIFLSGCVSTGPEQQSMPTHESNTLSTELVENTPKNVASAADDIATVSPLDPAKAEDVWERIRIQLSFALPDHQRVKNRIQWYANQPNYMNVISQRADPFLYYIVTEIERRGLPVELALVPLFESDFNTTAYSDKHASGLWQLTPLIAKHFGVKMNSWYDGRLDIVESTNAALDFLTYLHKRFDGNWLYAIAAYNTGEGRVANAIRRNKRAGKSTDFFSLQLPRETRDFVPKLLAAAHILKHQTIAFPAIANTPVITVAPLQNGVILDSASEWKEVAMLNPGYRRYRALLSGPEHIVLKIDKAHCWSSYVASLPAIPDSQWKTYRIKRGDSLSEIAQNFDVTVADIRTFNQLTHSRIRAGDELILPIPAEQQIEHKVRSGDSLWMIARQYNVTVDKLKQWNGLARSHLNIGDTLTIFLTP
ncbi:LysM peptidoglycan-binding domain-containing protein [Alteromonas gracilis]|uniref:LysM peptidoglycan-binding domain-containing protein n=1 Tax=Alteromonas gracilis TaxID=1479524 RepID=UPI0030CBA4C6